MAAIKTQQNEEETLWPCTCSIADVPTTRKLPRARGGPIGFEADPDLTGSCATRARRAASPHERQPNGQRGEGLALGDGYAVRAECWYGSSLVGLSLRCGGDW